MVAVHVRCRLGPYEPVVRDLLVELVDDVVWHFDPADRDPAEVLVTIGTRTVDVESALDEAVRWVHVLGTGVNSLPFAALTDRIVTCSRGASAIPIAEFVLAAMLAFERHIPEVWVDEPPVQWGMAEAGELGDRTIGLFGYGAIGSAIAQRALPFGPRVLMTRRTETPPDNPRVRAVAFDTLLRESDHLVLAAPATPETYHLVGVTALQRVKRGVHLINVARGDLVDETALLSALDTGAVARATLDVTEVEPLPSGSALYSHPRVRLSPHVSWASPHSNRRVIERFAVNLRSWRNGQPLSGVVNTRLEY